MHKIIRFLPILLVILLMTALSPTTALATDGQTFTIDNVTYYKLTENGDTGTVKVHFSNCSGDVVIPAVVTSGSITYTVTAIGYHAFYNCNEMTSISIPAGMTSIGDYAFEGCTSLTSISLPDGLTSVGDLVFSGCSSLTGISIPDGVTSIGTSAFSGCTSLTSISLPDGVTSIGGGHV